MDKIIHNPEFMRKGNSDMGKCRCCFMVNGECILKDLDVTCDGYQNYVIAEPQKTSNSNKFEEMFEQVNQSKELIKMQHMNLEQAKELLKLQQDAEWDEFRKEAAMRFMAVILQNPRYLATNLKDKAQDAIKAADILIEEFRKTNGEQST